MLDKIIRAIGAGQKIQERVHNKWKDTTTLSTLKSIDSYRVKPDFSEHKPILEAIDACIAELEAEDSPRLEDAIRCAKTFRYTYIDWYESK